MKFGMYPDRVWWTRPGFIAAGAFLLLVVVLAIWIATTRTTATPDATGPVTTTLTPSSTETGGAVTPPPSTSSPSPAPGEQAVLDQAPPDVSWTLWHGIALPTSPSAGPSNVHDGIAEGYTHTPVGSLIAAQQITTRFAFGNSHMIADKQMVPGPGRTAVLGQAKDGDGGTSGAGQQAGFKFVSYTGDTAVLLLAFKLPGGEFRSALVTMQWADSDWRLAPTPSGQLAASTQTIPSLSGFVAWAGVA